jgi:N-ethylmaleimide reductase
MESTPQSNNNLLSPDAQWSDSIQMGDLLLENRIVMASLTRCRCNPDNNIPTAINADYYAQRAGAGFIIT